MKSRDEREQLLRATLHDACELLGIATIHNKNGDLELAAFACGQAAKLYERCAALKKRLAPKPAKKTQRTKVELAVREGCRTSPEVAMETGLPVKHASAYLRMLEGAGRVKRTGTVPAASSHGGGRAAVFFEPC